MFYDYILKQHGPNDGTLLCYIAVLNSKTQNFSFLQRSKSEQIRYMQFCRLIPICLTIQFSFASSQNLSLPSYFRDICTGGNQNGMLSSTIYIQKSYSV